MTSNKRYKVFTFTKRGLHGITLWDTTVNKAFNGHNGKGAFEALNIGGWSMHDPYEYFKNETLIVEVNSIDEYKFLYPEEFI